MADGDTVGGGQILLEAGGVHVLLAAAVTDRHLFGAEQLGLHGSIHRRHAAADDDDAAPDRQAGKIAGLTQLGNEVDRVGDAIGIFAIGAQRVDTGKPHAEENGIILLGQLGELEVAA